MRNNSLKSQEYFSAIILLGNMTDEIEETKQSSPRKSNVALFTILLIFFLLIITQISFVAIQPLGGLPDGITLVIYKDGLKLKLFDSPDAMCLRTMGEVSLLCRGSMLSLISESNPLYSSIDQRQIEYFRKAFSYKFHLSNLYLEQLWSLNYISDRSFTLMEVLINIFDYHQFDVVDLSLFSYAIEGFIIQGSAFLDLYMLHMCNIFKLGVQSYLSGKKFITALGKVDNETLNCKAKLVANYFQEKIFSSEKKVNILSNNWGNLLKDLRNSILHRDQLYPDFQSNKNLLDIIIGNWPEKERDLPVSRFCQDVQNEMFYQITELAAIVYGFEWKPGPYKPDLW